MALVITGLCAGTCDTSCVEVCPFDCIHGPLDVEQVRQLQDKGDTVRLANIQLYIDPDVCTECGACEPECPVEAIFEEDDVPERWRDYIALNRNFFAG